MILDALKKNLMPFGSELGLGLSLFSLTVSIRAANVLEIGRYKGYSTLALASALKFVDIGWQEPEQHKQRAEIDYEAFEGARGRWVTSLDPAPASEAADLLGINEVLDYAELLEIKSDDYEPDRAFDLVFIDGDHTTEQIVKDFDHFYPAMRPGGYIVLHDYFYDGISPIQVALDIINYKYDLQELLIDTGYMSFVIMRKNGEA